MFDSRHILAARLRPLLLPQVRRIAEDVLQDVIQRRSMPGRTEFREMQARAEGYAQTLEALRIEHPTNPGQTPSWSDGR